VIAASANDFEEMGVDPSTLDEMKQVSGKTRERRMLLASPCSQRPSFLSACDSYVPAFSFWSNAVLLFMRRAHSQLRTGLVAWHCVVLGGAESGAELPAVSQRDGGALSIWVTFIAPAPVHACAKPRTSFPCWA
jgi:hypothetical protein